jgi:predicted Rossmann fold nucleotide-binding protein DprA/Smf involved in DNA uptake
MDNFLTNDTKAIILLCGILGKDRSVPPLSQSEYNALARWLINGKKRPAALLGLNDLSEASVQSGIDCDRLEKLLDRGVQLGFAIEEWQRSGIWIISRSDPEYPARYKSHLKEKAPPLLFGAGDKSLLQGGGVAIVGSRNVDTEGEQFTRSAVDECVYNRIPVVSGGARGVDQIAMRAALEGGGVTIGVLADNLLKASIERHARYAIAEGQMLLISPYHPHARFTVGSAMGRNKLIYAMADYGLVISAEHKKGGTWAGAEEELKRDTSIAVFVRAGDNVPIGNKKLLELGALNWPTITKREDLLQQLNELADNRPASSEAEPETPNLFDFQSQQPALDQTSKEPKGTESPQKMEKAENVTTVKSIYEAVLPVIIAQLVFPTTADELSTKLNVDKGQLNSWLKKAVAEGSVRKHQKPVRYSVGQ